MAGGDDTTRPHRKGSKQSFQNFQREFFKRIFAPTEKLAPMEKVGA
jgi:hypothetical protein